MSNTCLYNYIFYSIHDLFEIYSVLAEPVTELVEVPLGGIFTVVSLGSTTFDVVFSFLVHRVICKMNKAFLQRLRIIRILLSSKPYKTLLKEEDLERVEARD